MKLGLVLGYWGTVPELGLDLTLQAERLGYDSVWVAEAYGTDAFTPLAWLGAQTKTIKLGTGVAQMPARTPAMTAMTASTLDMLTGGRLLLGLGFSGPQVVEGWHGMPHDKPIGRSREYIAILRAMFGHERVVEFDGKFYQLPYKGPDATGLGRPLKFIHKPVRTDIPIYLGAMGPKNVTLAAEAADGWFPHLLSPLHLGDVYEQYLATGFARSSTPKHRDNFDIFAQVYVTVGDDLDECRRIEKKRLALILGGYGSRHNNFYVNTVSRYGYSAVCEQVQELFLSGRKAEAAAAIPDEIIDELTIVGPRDHVVMQMERWMKSGIDGFAAWTSQPEALDMIADVSRMLSENAGASPAGV